MSNRTAFDYALHVCMLETANGRNKYSMHSKLLEWVKRRTPPVYLYPFDTPNLDDPPDLQLLPANTVFTGIKQRLLPAGIGTLDPDFHVAAVYVNEIPGTEFKSLTPKLDLCLPAPGLEVLTFARHNRSDNVFPYLHFMLQNSEEFGPVISKVPDPITPMEHISAKSRFNQAVEELLPLLAEISHWWHLPAEEVGVDGKRMKYKLRNNRKSKAKIVKPGSAGYIRRNLV